MKLTKAKLTEMIKQELKELSGTAGGTATLQKQKKADSDIKTKTSDKKTKKSAWDTAKATYQTKQATYDTKSAEKDAADAEYDQKSKDLENFANNKYRRKGLGGWQYSKTLQKGYSLNPDWTEKANRKSLANTDKLLKRNAFSSAETERNSALSDRDTKKTDYDSAAAALGDAEKAAKAFKKQTGFGFGAGAGGRASGKGGTGKKGGKKGGTKDESLFRILGRELVNELKDIKKYS